MTVSEQSQSRAVSADRRVLVFQSRTILNPKLHIN